MQPAFYESLRSLQVFLGVVVTLLTAAGDAIPLPVRWLYPLHCVDDRALLTQARTGRIGLAEFLYGRRVSSVSTATC
jgi:hypothetical protein